MKNGHFTSVEVAPPVHPAFEKLAPLGRVHRFAPHTIVVSEGDFSDSSYFILQGRVKTFVSEPDGREIVLSVLGPGECFGEAVLDGGPRSASVVTLELVSCKVVARALLRSAMAEDPQLAMWMIDVLIGRLRVATGLVKDLALHDVYARVTHLLQGMAREHAGVLAVPERMSQQEIAHRVGASRDMVGRVVKELIDGGYIAMEHKAITLIRKFPLRW